MRTQLQLHALNVHSKDDPIDYDDQLGGSNIDDGKDYTAPDYDPNTDPDSSINTSS